MPLPNTDGSRYEVQFEDGSQETGTFESVGYGLCFRVDRERYIRHLRISSFRYQPTGWEEV